MKTKYIILAVFNGITKEFKYTVDKKAEAINDFKNMRLRADRIRMFSIDSEDDTIWYDIGKNY